MFYFRDKLHTTLVKRINTKNKTTNNPRLLLKINIFRVAHMSAKPSQPFERPHTELFWCHWNYAVSKEEPDEHTRAQNSTRTNM